MTGLETAFYIVGIVYMGLMLILFIALLAAVLVIKKKVSHVHEVIDEKIAMVQDATARVSAIVRTVRNFVKH